MIETVQFRDFFFPHNPATITVSREGNHIAHFCPGHGEVLQRIGGGGRTVTLKGCFFGASYEQANAQLHELIAAANGPGTLFLPGCEPFLAELKELTTESAGDGRVIPYVIIFREAGGMT
jgi:hypothetical protein